MNIRMDSPGGVTLDTTGKYCTENIKVVPNFDFSANSKRWTIELSEPITTSTTPIITDDWLKEHRKDENLVLCLIAAGDYTSSEYKNFIICIFGNTKISKPECGNFNYGIAIRINGDAGNASVFGSYESKLTAESVGAAGKMRISTNGDLFMTLNETYILAPGIYTVIAWLN